MPKVAEIVREAEGLLAKLEALWADGAGRELKATCVPRVGYSHLIGV
jgi:hypothetical protein